MVAPGVEGTLMKSLASHHFHNDSGNIFQSLLIFSLKTHRTNCSALIISDLFHQVCKRKNNVANIVSLPPCFFLTPPFLPLCTGQIRTRPPRRRSASAAWCATTAAARPRIRHVRGVGPFFHHTHAHMRQNLFGAEYQAILILTTLAREIVQTRTRTHSGLTQLLYSPPIFCVTLCDPPIWNV